MALTFSPYSLEFKSQVTIYQNQYKCQVSENEFNTTLNPSAIKSGSTEVPSDNITGSAFSPYCTSIGLYNDLNELILVGKLYRPIQIPQNNDITFIIRYDS